MILKDRVKETTTTTGNGAVSLAGAAAGFTSFFSALGNAVVADVPYCIAGGAEWEVGRGTFNGPALTLARTTVEASSNAGNAVVLSAGSKDVFLSLSASSVARIDQVSLFPTVTSATATDIFGAAGATISIDNSTPVTTTSFSACTSAQVGSVKRVIPVQNWSVTASANLVVDGATSGTFVMPAGAKLEVLASTTTLFQLTTIHASGAWTPSGWTGGGTGITYSGVFVKRGNEYTVDFNINGTGLTSTTNVTTLSGLPANANADHIGNIGSIINGSSGANGLIQAYSDGKIYVMVTFSSATSILGTIRYRV